MVVTRVNGDGRRFAPLKLLGSFKMYIVTEVLHNILLTV